MSVPPEPVPVPPGPVPAASYRVEEPSPPTAYWHHTSYRRARGFDSAAVERSASALAAYGEAYREEERAPYPLRVTLNPMTGLPALLNGYLPVRDSPATPDQPPTEPGALRWLAERWLLQPEVSRAAFGLEHDELQMGDEKQARLRRSREFRSNLGADKVQSAKLEGQYQQTEAVHLNLQQWHDGKWPVYGGQVSLHAGLGDIRVSLSSAFIPLRRGEPFEVRVDAYTAFKIAVAAFGKAVKQFDAKKWKVVLVPYEGRAVFLLPFKGDYRLAYCLETSSPAGDDGWRAFVSAEEQEGVILGPAEQLAAHVNSFFVASSSDALASPPVLGRNNILLGDLQTSLGSVVEVVDEADVPLDFTTFGEPLAPPQVNKELEAVNIAHHAKATLDYFTATCGVTDGSLQGYAFEEATIDPSPFGLTEITPAQQAPPLRLAVHKPAQGALETAFNPSAASNPKYIIFQTLDVQLAPHLTIYSPSLDPEVIAHELAHAIMWLLNPLPFSNPNATVPFTRALLEGYASYFARSLAARDGNDAANNPARRWALGAYRQAEWGDRWAFVRPRNVEGADFLAQPNQYPAAAQADLGTYDLGMVWARALWDVRELLRTVVDASGVPPAGAVLDKRLKLADRLALDGFYYCLGLISSFEVAAEGVLFAAQSNADSRPCVPDLRSLFARRGIVPAL